MSDVTIRFKGDASGAVRAGGQARGAITGVGGAASRVGRAVGALAIGAGVGLVAGLGKAIGVAADFEKVLDELGAVSNATGQDMGRLRDQALEAGKATKFSASEAASAQVELAKAGLSVAQILEGGLDGALSLAAAGNLELADAASIAANSMNLFGLEGKDVTSIADALAVAANTTTADVADFGVALTQGGAAAKQAGLSFQDSIVILEALAASGVKNSDAGTSMKNTLIQLLAPTKQQAALAREAGLSFTDQAGKMKDVATISGDLRTATEDMTKAERLAFFARLAGTDGFRTLAALYDAGPEKLQKYRAALDDEGAAARVAAEMNDNLRGKLEGLKGSVETLAIEFGSRLVPAVSAGVDGLTRFLNTKGFEAKIKVVLDAAEAVGTKAAQIGGDAGKAISASLGRVNWEETGNKIARGIGEAFRQGIPTLAKFSDTLVEGLTKAIQGADWATIGAAIGQGIKDGTKKAAKKKVEEGLDDVLRNASSLGIRTAAIAGAQIGEALADKFGSKTQEEVPNKMGTIPIMIRQGVDPAIAVAAAGGSRIGAGLAGGLTAALSGVGASVANTIIWQLNSTELQLKQKYGIHSPSTVWAQEIGKPLADGIYEGIYGAFAQHHPRVIAALDRLTEAMKTKAEAASNALGASFERLGGYIDRAFGAKTQQLLTALGARFDEQINKVRAWQQELTAGERALQSFQNTLAGQGPTASEVELAGLDASEAERSRVLALRAAEEALAKAQTITDAQEKAAAVLAAEEQLRTAQLAITRARLGEQAAAERLARDTENAARLADLTAQAAQERAVRDQQALDRIAQLETQKAAELANLEEFRRIQGEELMKRLTELQTHLAKHPKEWDKTNKKIQALLKSHGIDYRASGELLGSAFAWGLRDSYDRVEKAAKGLAAIPAKYLPHSPAEKGPLSKLPDWESYFMAGFPAATRAISRAVASIGAGSLGSGGVGFKGLSGRGHGGGDSETARLLRDQNRLLEMNLRRPRVVDLDMNFAGPPAADPHGYSQRARLAIEAQLG